MLTRRRFLHLATRTAAVITLRPAFAAGDEQGAAFFLAGDTHYLANKDVPDEMDPISRDVNARLIDWLNKLPGTAIPDSAGGGKVAAVRGVIHAGDCIDSGDKTGGAHLAMQKTELAAFTADWGLNGGDGRLRFPVREAIGNHDAPRGTGAFMDHLIQRNKTRGDIAALSPNGIHFSWDWDGVHFINLGLIVGHDPGVARPRRYATLESLAFLRADLAEKVGDSGRPVVITHHVDVARYCAESAPDVVITKEWDYADLAAYHAELGKYRIAAILYGHTHARKIFTWDGKPPKAAKPGQPPAPGIPTFNNDNSGHFKSETQALLYFEVSGKEVICREFATEDGWLTAGWTPEVWRFPVA